MGDEDIIGDIGASEIWAGRTGTGGMYFSSFSLFCLNVLVDVDFRIDEGEVGDTAGEDEDAKEYLLRV